MTQFIPPSDLSFDAYKASLKTFLQGQDRFKDYDFEGSNLAVLIDLLALNTFNNAHYLNMVGSEMFLDSAQLRESIVSHAKELNYTPRSRISSRALVTVEVSPQDSPASITIPKFYGFKTTSTSSNTIRFLTDQPIVLKRDTNGRYISAPITVYEGQIVSESFNVLATNQEGSSITYNQRFNLQSNNIDTTSIEVSVKADSNDQNPAIYTRALTLAGLDGNSNVFFIRGYKANQYEIEFGDGVLGHALTQGNIISVTYRDTIGVDGNGTYVFNKTSAIDGYSAVTVSTGSRATGGAERESDDEIKYNAVRHFQTQDRSIIEADYESLIKENFPEIQEVNVYGGEKIFKYGKVMIVLKPHNIDGVVDDNTKSRIVAFLRTKNIVPEPIIQDPEYFYLGVTGHVYYAVARTTSRDNEIEAAAVQALLALNESDLADFNVRVYQSAISGALKATHAAITGADVTLSIIRRVSPNFGNSTTYSFTCDNPIISSVQGEYISSDSYSVSSTVFQMVVNDAITNVLVQDNGIGSLHLYQIISGVKVRVPIAIGSVDYATGSVSFTADIYAASPTIQVTCKMVNDTLDISLNKFVTVNAEDIALEMVAV